MKHLLIVILIIFMAQGCRTYSIEKQTPDGMIKVEVSTSADMEAPTVHYKREGDDVTFDFSAESLDSNTEDFMGVFQGIMGMMMQMMERMMAMPPVVSDQ